MKLNKITAVLAFMAAAVFAQAGAAHAFGVHGMHSNGYGDTVKAKAKAKTHKSFKKSSARAHRPAKAHKKASKPKSEYRVVPAGEAKENLLTKPAEPPAPVLTAKETGIPQGAKGKNSFTGKWYVPLQDIAPRYTDNLEDWSCIGPVLEIGEASWYSVATNHGNAKTSSMEPFDEDAMVAAHRNLPNGAVVCVTVTTMGPQGNNGLGTKGAPLERTVRKFRITDSGPYAKDRKGDYRVIDLAAGAVEKHMHFYNHGVAQVGVQVARKMPGL